MLINQSCPTLCNPRDRSLPGSSVMEFSRQEYWRGLLFSTPGNLPYPGIEPASPELAGEFFTTEPAGKPCVGRDLDLSEAKRPDLHKVRLCTK